MTASDTPPAQPAGPTQETPGQVQRRSQELHLLACYAATARKGPLRSARVSVSEGSTVHVSGVDADRTLYVEPHVLVEAITPPQVWAVVQDLFKLALVARTHPGARTVLLVGGEPAASSVRRLLASAPGLSIVDVEIADVTVLETDDTGIDFAGSC